MRLVMKARATSIAKNDNFAQRGRAFVQYSIQGKQKCAHKLKLAAIQADLLIEIIELPS